MSVITVTRAATPDEISAEMDRRGAVIERLETDLRHWREECGKLHARLAAKASDPSWDDAVLALRLQYGEHGAADWLEARKPK